MDNSDDIALKCQKGDEKFPSEKLKKICFLSYSMSRIQRLERGGGGKHSGYRQGSLLCAALSVSTLFSNSTTFSFHYHFEFLVNKTRFRCDFS